MLDWKETSGMRLTQLKLLSKLKADFRFIPKEDQKSNLGTVRLEITIRGQLSLLIIRKLLINLMRNDVYCI